MHSSINKYNSSFELTLKIFKEFLSDEGITIISGLLQTHSAGISVKTTLIRNDIAIKNIFDNPSYDNNYQSFIDIEPVKLKQVFKYYFIFIY
jgi:hypothetical protein